MTSFEECGLFIGLTSNEILSDEVFKVKSQEKQKNGEPLSTRGSPNLFKEVTV